MKTNWLLMLVTVCGLSGCAQIEVKQPAVETPAVEEVSAVSKEPAVTETKQEALDRLRQRYAGESYRSNKCRADKSVEECMALLDHDGVFSDLRATEMALRAEGADQSQYSEPQTKVSELNTVAFDRLWLLSETFRGEETKERSRITLRAKIFRGFVHYAAFEDGRAKVSGGRFHASCFAIPLANVNSYFCFFDVMDRVEKGDLTYSPFVQANQAMKTMGMQSWTQPNRNDETDDNVVSVDRFRKHVWWVGGNALAYRPVLHAAFMMNSIPMVDVLAVVAKEALSSVSHTTYDEAFWIEGFTADGAGWGHGRQCLIWGYPIHGGDTALSMLNVLRGSPWAQQLERSNIDTLMNFIRGSSWYYYNGFVPPCLSRGNMVYENLSPMRIQSMPLVERMLEDWPESLTESERSELIRFTDEADSHRIAMAGQPAGHYAGSRYFYDNDNLVVKGDDFYWFISMASVRCDGIESASDKAAEYNFYTCDGQTLFMRRGDEAKRALGGLNLTAFPGVTARQGAERLRPVTNWRGYCSKHNFAAGATRGGENACAGLIFEKLNASAKKGVNDRVGLEEDNSVLYGVRAYKSWFVFGDMMLALGAGVANLEPEQEGDVWTTIDQTIWESEVTSGNWTFGHDGETHQKALSLEGSIPWVRQASGFTYAVLPQHTSGEVSLLCERRASQWEKLAAPNAKKKNKPEYTDIFQLSINHGRNPTNDTYGYVVYAGEKNPEEVFAQSPVTVLSNTTNLQAAAALDGKVVQAIFYSPEAVLESGDHTFTVSAPCAFMAEVDGDGSLHLTVTDAEMNKQLNEIVVGINGVRSEKIALPSEPHRGKPAHVTVEGL